MEHNEPSFPVADPTRYKALSFDVFGTLVDWEGGHYPSFEPIIRQLPANHPVAAPFPPQASVGSRLADDHALFSAFNAHERRLMAELPTTRYETILGFAFRDLATQLGVTVTEEDVKNASTEVFENWLPFPDTLEALRRLGKHYKLIALSNVSDEGIARVLSTGFKDVKFDAVYTAQAIGSYKPAMDNFEYLLNGVKKDFGVEREQLLHVAHGVASDQVPADRMDIDHVWVERSVSNWGANKRADMKHLVGVAPNAKQLADEADEAFAKKP